MADSHHCDKCPYILRFPCDFLCELHVHLYMFEHLPSAEQRFAPVEWKKWNVYKYDTLGICEVIGVPFPWTSIHIIGIHNLIWSLINPPILLLVHLRIYRSSSGSWYAQYNCYSCPPSASRRADRMMGKWILRSNCFSVHLWDTCFRYFFWGSG